MNENNFLIIRKVFNIEIIIEVRNFDFNKIGIKRNTMLVFNVQIKELSK